MMRKARRSSERDYLEATEVTELLHIRPQTLYAYVSRGWINSIAQAGRKTRLYSREDVERVLSRSRARSGHGPVAASAMYWGEPIITTRITEITPEGPRYRGRSALELAASGTPYESVAELLWTGDWAEEPTHWEVRPGLGPATNLLDSRLGSNDELLEVFALATLKLGMARGGHAENLRDGRALDAAREIIQTMTGCFGYISRRRTYVPMRSGQPVAEALMQGLGLEDSEENRRALGSILVLYADHELSPGALVARVAAASGATLHACIVAAITAASGTQHARLHVKVEELLASSNTKKGLLGQVQRMQRDGKAVPGFGKHSVYRSGDPRGKFLLELAKKRGRQSRRLDAICGLFDEAESKLGLYPRHELAAVALTEAMGLPANSAGPLFTLARTAGWVAHAVEQQSSKLELRPRAKFDGLRES